MVAMADYLLTKRDYVAAFRKIRSSLKPPQLAVLRAQLSAPANLITSTEMADAAGFKSWQPANLAYGKIGTMLRDALGSKGQFPGQRSHALSWVFKPELPKWPHWRIQMHPQVADALLELKWFDDLSPTKPKDQQDIVTSAIEGEIEVLLQLRRKRERKLRDAKIREAIQNAADGRLRCEVSSCGFDFEEKYGELGRGFAEVHHRTPLSVTDSPAVTTLSDLAVVCSNCHSMLHRSNDSRSLSSLARR